VYMSPEQVKADKTIDHRSDIYSLGVTLYYAINGKPPYDGNTTSQFEIFNKIVYEPLPQLQGNSHLNELVLKACQKERELRFQTCEEWLIALKKGLEPSNQPLDSEKTMVDVPIAEKTTVDALAGDKTVFESPVLEKTTIEQNPSIEQSKEQEQNKEKHTSQPINQERVGSKRNSIALVTLIVLIIVGISLWSVSEQGGQSQDSVDGSQNAIDTPSATQEDAPATMSVEAPAEEVPVQAAPAEEDPAEEDPAEEDPTEEAPAEEAPVEEYNFDDYL